MRGFLKIIDDDKEENVNDAKQAAITYAYSDTQSANSGNYVDETKLVFIGDSWIEGLGNQSCKKTSYVYGATGKNADHFDGSKMNIPSDASGIVIEFGLNDPSGYAKTQKLAEDLHSKHSNVPIFILKTSHVASGYSGNGLDADSMNKEIDVYNERMKEWCEGNDYATYLDVTKTINENNGNGVLKSTYDNGSEFHLNEEGYKAWYKDIIDAISVNSGFASSNDTTTDNSNDNTNKIVIQPNKDKTGYEIAYNNDKENIDRIKDKFYKQTGKDISKFTEFELGVLGAFMDNGSNLDYYTGEQLHCFPAFLKAEACTQFLDLRPNSKKMKDGKYVPVKLEDLAENEVPGIILVQRTNTNSNSPVILEYKKESEFNSLVSANNKDAIKYFTINSKGNLIVAKWDHTTITVNGTYPENISASERETPTDKDEITTEEIAYSEYIKKYTMPFEFLVQLLVIIDEPDFCNELVNHVLDSKIVINVQEEETITEINEKKDYTVHNKDLKFVDYNIEAFNQHVTSKTDAFLHYNKDDERK